MNKMMSTKAIIQSQCLFDTRQLLFYKVDFCSLYLKRKYFYQ